MSGSATTFQDLRVWQKSHALTLAIYEATRQFPRHETFGLTQQLRRAAVSVPSNIAEGFRWRSRWDKVRLLNIAAASLEEAQYQLLLAHERSIRLSAMAVTASTVLALSLLSSISYLLYSFP